MPQLSAMSFVVFIGFNAAANAANTSLSSITRPLLSCVGERFSVFDDVGKLASSDLTDTDKLIEVERPAIEFAVKTVAWNACLYSDLILREPSVFYGALEDITNLSRCHIFNLLQTEPPKFYLRLICVI